MKITINVPKITFTAGITMAIIGGCTDINHMGWLNWVMMIVGVAAAGLVVWATGQRRKQTK